ncbi:MAG TPA: SOS response-associated peptidase family protein [Eoetvoesiella sp.]
MCGRISQANDLSDYIETIRWTPYALLEDPVGPRYNVPAGTRPLVMHRLGNGDEKLDRIFWGYARPRSRQSPNSNASVKALLNNNDYWKNLFEYGRVIVPADGWYEWKGRKPNKEPWFIHAKDGQPVLLAAISAWHPGDEHGKYHGMAVVTDDDARGVIDLHDRRPIVLMPDDAAEWINPATTTCQAKELFSAARPESAFEWCRATLQ